MPGPKIPRPNSARDANISASAVSMVGIMPAAGVNCPKMLDPMPTITASTSTLMPAEMTFPRTRSARNAVLFQSANGTSTNPASVVSLNSISVTKSWTARMKKLAMTTSHARSSTAIVSRFKKRLESPRVDQSESSWAGQRLRRPPRVGPAAGVAPG